MTTAAKIEFKASAQFNPVFRPVNEWRGRYRILKGSAGSGKSVNIAQDYIAKLSDPAYTGANLLVVRKIEETNRDSTFAELQAAIYRMFGPYADRFWKVNLNPLALECKITGNRIIFRGVKDQRQREKVKSITFKNGKLVWIWCEEATELLSEDVDILDDRLRGNLNKLNPNLYYQITMTFNPVSATHWIKGRYFDKADPDVLAHHSTYKTNRFIDPAYFRRMRDQTARSVVRALDSLEREYGANFSKIFRTITVDNGSEFADCAGMEKSCRRKGNRTKIYYCHPYSSYERGSNENVNRMIRRWFPKGTDFRKVTAKAIQKVEDWINNYPREILGFRTAEAVFQEGVACLI